MTVTLKKISVSGFKSIRKMELELTSLNVLIGANGAGKSNFIEVFRLLNEIVEGRLRAYAGVNGANSLLYFGRKVTDKITINVESQKSRYEVRLVPSTIDSLFLSEEVVQGQGAQSTVSERHATGGVESSLYYSDPSFQHIIDDIATALRGCKVYHFQDISSEARVKQTQKIDDNRYLRPDGANLAPYLYLLQERYKPFYDRLVRTVRLIAPFFDTFVLVPDRIYPDNIRLEWRERGSDEYFNAHTLSDGTLRFICLATLLLQPEPPSVILIDEPELGLHPYALNYLAGMIRSVSTQTQIIISTQSVTLLDQFTPEDVIVVDREDRQSVFKRLSSEELAGWLDEYSLGELWEKNVLGGRRQPQEP